MCTGVAKSLIRRRPRGDRGVQRVVAAGRLSDRVAGFDGCRQLAVARRRSNSCYVVFVAMLTRTGNERDDVHASRLLEVVGSTANFYSNSAGLYSSKYISV